MAAVDQKRDPRSHATRSGRRLPRAKELDHFAAEALAELHRVETEQRAIEASSSQHLLHAGDVQDVRQIARLDFERAAAERG